MGGCSRNSEACPQLLDLIPKDTEWFLKRDEERRHGSSEEKKLELRLAPPGEDWLSFIDENNVREKDESPFSVGYFSNIVNNNASIPKRVFLDRVERKSGDEGWIMGSNGGQTQKFTSSENPAGAVMASPWPSSAYSVKTSQQQSQQRQTPFLQFPSTAQSLPVMAKESSQPCCNKVVDLQNAEKKAFSPAPANPAVPNSSQKRTAPAPVVGWPPIRSFRKNLASSSSTKPAPEQQHAVSSKGASEKLDESCRKGLFVKINMDGVPIGRKVDLKAYDSYEQLSSAVDELFRGLLAAQKDSSAGGGQNKQEDKKAITVLLDGSGEYTLVYEDNEGDRMLVGDVPWHMFVSTAKRLRVLKSSEISALCVGSNKPEKMHLVSAMK